MRGFEVAAALPMNLDDAAAALAEIDERRAAGKVVLRVRGQVVDRRTVDET